MSRLDSFIRRVTAQRACLDAAIAMVRDLPGPVFEFGLGNGRTYDHLRENLPGRDIFVFERKVMAHPDSVPPEEFLILGDVEKTAGPMADRLEGQVALAHLDIGTGDRVANARLVAALSPHLSRAMAAGGVVASDQPLAIPRFEDLSLPEGVPPERYHLYRVRPSAL